MTRPNTCRPEIVAYAKQKYVREGYEPSRLEWAVVAERLEADLLRQREAGIDAARLRLVSEETE